ncbi:uncharacterized protein LOC135332524 [Halichondria panicea]|uniref:uncharacterized protein LOC135332524 n=1 Tax=Halichondria panicea TaxID=6063 RepID=UPI00312B5E6B
MDQFLHLNNCDLLLCHLPHFTAELYVSFDCSLCSNVFETLTKTLSKLCHLPHFTAELYVNFDCSLYCSNVFETLTKTLSKILRVFEWVNTSTPECAGHVLTGTTIWGHLEIRLEEPSY